MRGGLAGKVNKKYYKTVYIYIFWLLEYLCPLIKLVKIIILPSSHAYHVTIRQREIFWLD